MSVSKNTSFKKGADPNPNVSFGDDDYGSTVPSHEDPLVVLGFLVNFEVKRIFMDQGSSTDIIFGG